MNTNVKITIPEPCHEDWGKMHPREQGRHCDSCNKTVVDFTQKSHEEIVSYIGSHDNTCGRFKSTDIYNPTIIDGKTYIKPSWFRSKWLAFIAAGTFLGFGKKAYAQGQVTAYTPEKTNDVQTGAKKSHTVFHGWVKNSDTKKGIAQVEIRIYSGGKEIALSYSFANGSYFITIPENTIYDYKVDIEYNAINFKSQVLKDLPVNKDRIKCDALLAFTPPYDSIGDVVGVYEEEPEKPKMQYATLGGPIAMTGQVCVNEIPKTAVDTGMAKLTVKKFDKLIDEKKTDQKSNNNTSTGNVVNYVKKEETKTEISETAFNVSAYPNPTTGVFNIKIDNSEKSELFVFDVSGKLVMSKKTNSQLETVDMTGKPNGTYVVRVINMAQNKVKQVKVIKTN